jgi:putative nucleotidyltransferase with HDIG domain
MDRDRIRKAVNEAPLLSGNASRLMQIMVDPDHELVDVVALVKLDSVLTARLLRIVNSPVFGMLQAVSSVDRAVAYLGERMIVSVALADSISKMMNQPLKGYESRQGDLWRHDLFTALAARQVSYCAKGGIEGDLAYTGGLLHDIGKAIMSGFLEGTADQATKSIDSGKSADYLAAEQEILGLDHAEVGYELALAWQLPEPLPQLIRHHHQPGMVDEKYRPVAYAVHLGDLVAMMSGCGTGSDTMQYKLDNGYEDCFVLSADQLAGIMVQAQDEFQKAEEFLAV